MIVNIFKYNEPNGLILIRQETNFDVAVNWVKYKTYIKGKFLVREYSGIETADLPLRTISPQRGFIEYRDTDGSRVVEHF